MDRVAKTNEDVNRSMDASLKLEELYLSIETIGIERRNFLLTRESTYQWSILEIETHIDKQLKELSDFIDTNKLQHENFDVLKNLIQQKFALANETTHQGTRTNSQESISSSIVKGNELMEQIVNQIHTMLQVEKERLATFRAELVFKQRSTPIYLYIISIFSLGLLAFAFYKISKDSKNQKSINQELQLSIDTLGLAEKVGNNGIWTLDLNSGALKFSSHLYKLLGLNSSVEPSLERFIEQVHPEDQDFVAQKFKDLKTDNNLASFRYRVVDSVGQQRQFQSLGQRVETKEGNIILLVMTTDVTREIEDQLKLEGINYVLSERNKNLSVANENYLEAEKIGYFGTWQFFFKEKEFVFSENFLRLFGIDPASFSQQIKHLLPYVYSEDRELVAQMIQKIYDGQEFEPFVSRIMPADHHQIRYISTTCRRISNPYSGDYILVITQDISEEFLVKLDLEQKNVILEANNSELQAFNYAASHDLQEPLRKIETFLSRLRETNYENLTPNGKQYMDRTLVAANRMRSLIDDLLHFSRSTRSEENFERTDLNGLMRNALEELAHLIEEKQAIVTFEHLPTIEVIPFQIQQVFVNLISNSLKYSKKGQVPRIDILSEKSSSDKEAVIRNEIKTKFFKFTFKDNGIGFENQYSEKIFTLFNRLHSREDYRGTGIGLAICKKVVENHGGYIYAQGEPEQGAIFTILLPDRTE